MTAGGLPQVPPLADNQAAARHWSWVLKDLPALGQMGTMLKWQFLQQNVILGNLLHQHQVDNVPAAWQVDKAPKEFLHVYLPAAVKIQMLCEAATEANLPPTWKVLPNVKKKEAVVAVSQLVKEHAQQVDSFQVAPVLSPEVLE